MVGIGESALKKGCGSDIVVIGNKAGGGDDTLGSRLASGSTAIGYRSMAELNGGQASLVGQTTCIGAYSGERNAGAYATAVGYKAGRTNLGDESVCIGQESSTNNSTGAVAIGKNCSVESANYSIAIGANCDVNHSGVLMLNATGSTLSSGGNGRVYVAPLRSVSGSSSGFLYYNPSTGEVVERV